MTFADFIYKYYLPPQQKEIILILNDLYVYQEMESSFNYLIQSAQSRNKNEIVSQFVVTIRVFLTALYKPLYKIRSGKQKAYTQEKVEELTSFLIKETYYLFGLNLVEYFNSSLQTVRKTCSGHSCNFSILEKFLSLDNINAITIAEQVKNSKEITGISKPLKLEWQGMIQLDLFVYDLTNTFRGIKGKKQVYFLFDKTSADFKIELPSKYLLPFLILFYELHATGAIKVIGNRGLFVYLNQHLEAPPNDRFPNRDFRKLRREAEQNKIIKCSISEVIKPLLDKYCSNQQ